LNESVDVTIDDIKEPTTTEENVNNEVREEVITKSEEVKKEYNLQCMPFPTSRHESMEQVSEDFKWDASQYL